MMTGLSINVLGPVGPVLMRHLSASPHSIGSIYSAEGLGNFLGSLLLGPVLSRLRPHAVLVGVSALVFLCLGAVPSCSALHQVASLYLLIGLASGLGNATANTSLTWAWHGAAPQLAAAFNLVNSCFPLGGAPLPRRFHRRTAAHPLARRRLEPRSSPSRPLPSSAAKGGGQQLGGHPPGRGTLPAHRLASSLPAHRLASSLPAHRLASSLPAHRLCRLTASPPPCRQRRASGRARLRAASRQLARRLQCDQRRRTPPRRRLRAAAAADGAPSAARGASRRGEGGRRRRLEPRRRWVDGAGDRPGLAPRVRAVHRPRAAAADDHSLHRGRDSVRGLGVRLRRPPRRDAIGRGERQPRCSRDAAEMQPRCSRDAAEVQPRCSRGAAEVSEVRSDDVVSRRCAGRRSDRLTFPSTAQAAYLSSLYWSAFVVGRLSATPLAAYFSPGSILVPSLALEARHLLDTSSTPPRHLLDTSQTPLDISYPSSLALALPPSPSPSLRPGSGLPRAGPLAARSCPPPSLVQRHARRHGRRRRRRLDALLQHPLAARPVPPHSPRED